MDSFLRKLGIALPIIQAPMAGVSTPELAAAVSNAGGLGSIGVGSVDADVTRQMIAAVRARTERPFQVNVFCHQPAVADAAREAASLALGACAAQLGTAFIVCPETAADAGYRAALLGPAAEHTVMTAVISGRPARCLANRFTALANAVERDAIPDYPIAYDAGKALHAAAKGAGDYSYGAQWAGQGAPLARVLPAAELVAVLRSELDKQ